MKLSIFLESLRRPALWSLMIPNFGHNIGNYDFQYTKISTINIFVNFQNLLTKFCIVIDKLFDIIPCKFCLNWLRFCFLYTKRVGLQFLLGHTVDAKKIMFAFCAECWKKWIIWLKTVQNDLKSHNFTLTEAQNRSLWRLLATFGAMHSTNASQLWWLPSQSCIAKYLSP